MSETANLQEIFFSIQGEGLYIGAPTCFVRFSGCNLRCDYCDTKDSWKDIPEFEGPSSLKFKNPIDTKKVAEIIDSYQGEYVSFTGGEPLLYPEFITQAVGMLKKKKKILLETNGTLPDSLAQVNNYVDIYSVDIKIKYWQDKKQEIIDFIRSVKKNSGSHYFKIIVEENWQDFQNVLKDVIDLVGSSDLVFQPKYGTSIDTERLIKFCHNHNKKEVFLIPQIHKTIGVR